MTDRLRRSFLYTPGDQADLVRKAVEGDADGVIVDLEDAVPEGNREVARDVVRNVLPTLDPGGAEVSVRINGLHTAHWIEDVEAAMAAGVDTLHLTMIDEAWQVRAVESVARTLTDGDLPEFVLILETPRSIFDARDLLDGCADSPVTAVTFGMSDYARAVGASQTSARIREFLSHWVVGHAAMFGLDAISSVYPDPRDLDTFESVTREAYEAGFAGQTAIHPDQVTVANEVFTPGEAEVERARELVAGFEAEESGSVVVDGVFMDRAHHRRYRDVIARYEAVAGRED